MGQAKLPLGKRGGFGYVGADAIECAARRDVKELGSPTWFSEHNLQVVVLKRRRYLLSSTPKGMVRMHRGHRDLHGRGRGIGPSRAADPPPAPASTVWGYTRSFRFGWGVSVGRFRFRCSRVPPTPSASSAKVATGRIRTAFCRMVNPLWLRHSCPGPLLVSPLGKVHQRADTDTPYCTVVAHCDFDVGSCGG